MIRRYIHADYEAVTGLLRANTPRYFHPDEATGLVDYLEHDSDDFFVYVHDKQVCACGGFNFIAEQGLFRISWDLVHPDFHGKGFGSRLLTYRLGLIEDLDPEAVVVVRTSQLVYPYYAKHGFDLRRTEKDYWAPGFDLYDMILIRKSRS